MGKVSALAWKYAPIFISVHTGVHENEGKYKSRCDVYSFASAYASAKGLPLGSAVSELLRQRAEISPEKLVEDSPRLRRNAQGLLVKARTGSVITPEMVKAGSEEDGD